MRIAIALAAALAVAAALLWASPGPGPEPAAPASAAQADGFIPGDEARKLLASGALLIDVREPAELAETGKIEGAINLPLGQLREQAASRSAPGLLNAAADRPVILYCRTGSRSEQAAQLLRSAGYQSVHNLGGLDDALAAGLPRG